jgi:putative SOS response-associated peptidase YedK
MINARSETAATKPAFRDALKFCTCPDSGMQQLFPKHRKGDRHH